MHQAISPGNLCIPKSPFIGVQPEPISLSLPGSKHIGDYALAPPNTDQVIQHHVNGQEVNELIRVVILLSGLLFLSMLTLFFSRWANCCTNAHTNLQMILFTIAIWMSSISLTGEPAKFTQSTFCTFTCTRSRRMLTPIPLLACRIKHDNRCSCDDYH